MSGKPAARRNDTTEHGGEIVIASADVLINGRGAARRGDFHTCPATTENEDPHVGGPIVEHSETVLINKRPAARAQDVCLCIVEPKEQPPCDTKFSLGGPENKTVGPPGTDSFKTKTDKTFYGLDARASCRVERLYDGELKGVAGKLTSTVDYDRLEAKLQIGYANDRTKGAGFAGLDGSFGGALYDGRLGAESFQIPIPFTGYGLSLGGELQGGLLAAELKGKLGAQWKNGVWKLEANLKGGVLLSVGAKLNVIVAPLNPPDEKPPEGVIKDVIVSGSPDVRIGD